MAHSKRKEEKLKRKGRPQPTITSWEEEVLIDLTPDEYSKVKATSPESLTESGQLKVPVPIEVVSSNDDESLLKKLKKEPCDPVPDWHTSEKYISLLRMLSKPRSFWDIVYCGRNRNDEVEPVDDGLKQIGESYRQVVERFLSEGLIQTLQSMGGKCDFADLVSEYKTLSELEEIAKQIGIEPVGTKNQMVHNIIQKEGAKIFWDVSVANELYVRTEKGTELVNDFFMNCTTLKDEMKNCAFRALCSGDFRTALRVNRNFEMHTQNDWLREASEANEIVRIIQFQKNVFRLDEKEFAKLKAALAMPILLGDHSFRTPLSGDKSFRNWFGGEIMLKTSGATIPDNLLQAFYVFYYEDFDENDILENIKDS
jgi:hypothetical protein